MFADMSIQSSGKHLICDLKEIQNVDLLTDMDGVKTIFDNICVEYEFCVLDMIEHRFENGAFTIIYMLSESHMSIHTFPERNYAAIDIYCCRNYENNDVYHRIYEYLVDMFSCRKDTPIIIDRVFS
jgi:hypothetical protein